MVIVEKGDISNEVIPHLVVVFEGLVGILPDVKAKAKFDKAIKRKKWKDAVRAFVLNDTVARYVWDVVWRHRYGMELVTFLGHEFAEELRTWMDEEDMPFNKVTATTPEKLSRSLSYRPDIAMVYDADASRWATYGSKGTIVNPSNPRFI